MIIGTFTYDGTSRSYSGEIVGLPFDGGVTFEPYFDPDEDAPAYRITAVANSNRYDLGAAWLRIDSQDRPYLTVTIDGYFLCEPMHAVLLIDQRPNILFWERRRSWFERLFS